MDYFNQGIMQLYQNIYYIIAILTVLVHVICAMAVAKDIGNFAKRNVTPQLMHHFGWVITVLISGVWGFLIYWLMHHSSLSRK